jgi:hypothetical protein
MAFENLTAIALLANADVCAKEFFIRGYIERRFEGAALKGVVESKNRGPTRITIGPKTLGLCQQTKLKFIIGGLM